MPTLTAAAPQIPKADTAATVPTALNTRRAPMTDRVYRACPSAMSCLKRSAKGRRRRHPEERTELGITDYHAVKAYATPLFLVFGEQLPAIDAMSDERRLQFQSAAAT